MGEEGQQVLILASYAPSLLNFRGPLLRDLGNAGHTVHVAAPDFDLALREGLEQMGAEVHETPLDRQGTGVLPDLRYFRVLRDLIRKTRPDLVLTYTIKPNIWGAFAAFLCGAPSAAMVTGLGYAFTGKGGFTQRISRFVAIVLYRLATSCNRVVVFQNPDDRNDFIAAGCLANPSKARMVNGSGVDCDHYAPAPLPDTPVFLMIARLLTNKGVREYGEAAIRLKHSRPQARCVLVGYFEEGPDSIAKADMDRWVAGGLEYVGKLDDVRPALASCSVYVLPSYREGTPRSVLEALATGRPVITCDAPGCRETVVDGLNGFLVPVGDVESLHARMAQLADDPDLRSRMAGESLRIAREKFDVGAVNSVLMRHLGLLHAC
ncbi:MAG: glycosyltransferase family 4 protein [Planctomycetia bacterium]